MGEKTEESPLVSPENQSEVTADQSAHVEQATSQHVIARVHQLLEVIWDRKHNIFHASHWCDMLSIVFRLISLCYIHVSVI